MFKYTQSSVGRDEVWTCMCVPLAFTSNCNSFGSVTVFFLVRISASFVTLNMPLPSKTRSGASKRTDVNISDLSDESKKIIDAITLKLDEKLEEIRVEFRMALAEKAESIKILESQVKILQSRVEKLEDAIDEGDAYERRDTLIISGEGLPEVSQDESSVSVVCSVVKDKLKLNLQTSDISTAHRMGRKPASQAPDKRKLVVKLCRRDVKKDILMAAKNLKPNIYVNESLTPIRSTILFVLRKMRRSHPNVIKGSTSMDGRVFAWIASDPGRPDSSNVRVLVNSHTKLLKLSEEKLGLPLESFIDQWSH